MYLNIALFLAIPEQPSRQLYWVLRFYDMLSSLKVTMATLTLATARKPFHQLSNLRARGLDLDPIYEGHEFEPDTMKWVSQYANANMIKIDFFEARSTAYAKSSALVDDL